MLKKLFLEQLTKKLLKYSLGYITGLVIEPYIAGVVCMYLISEFEEMSENKKNNL